MFSKSEAELPIRYLQSKFCAPRRTRSPSITSCNAHLSRNISAIVMPVLEGQRSIPQQRVRDLQCTSNLQTNNKKTKNTHHASQAFKSILWAFLKGPQVTPTKASVVVFTEFQSINLILCVFWFQDAGNKDIQTVQALTLTSFYTNRCDNCKAIGQLEANQTATKENRDVADCGCNKTTTKCLILARPQDDWSEKWRELLRLVSSSNHGTGSVI